MLATFFAQSAYNFQVFDNFTRTTQPPYSLTDHNFDRDTNDLGIRINPVAGAAADCRSISATASALDYFEPTGSSRSTS